VPEHREDESAAYMGIRPAGRGHRHDGKSDGRKRRAAMVSRYEVKVRRAYDVPEPADGARVLVDRIWPRGVSREKAALDEWSKAPARSTALREW